MPVTLDMSTAEPINAPPPDSGVTLDMSTAQPIDNAAPNQQPSSFLDKAGSLASGALSTLPTFKGIYDTLRHPYDATIGASRAAATTAAKRFNEPGITSKIVGGLEYPISGIPLIGPAVVNSMENAPSDPYRAAGEGLGMGLQAVAPEYYPKAAGVVSDVTSAAKDAITSRGTKGFPNLAPGAARGAEQIFRAAAPTETQQGFRGNIEAAAGDLAEIGKKVDLSQKAGGIISPDMRFDAAETAIRDHLKQMYNEERAPQIARNADKVVSSDFGPDATNGLQFLTKSAGQVAGRDLATSVLNSDETVPLSDIDSLARLVNKELIPYEGKTGTQQVITAATSRRIAGLKALDRELSGKISDTLNQNGEPGIQEYERRAAALHEIADRLGKRSQAVELARRVPGLEWLKTLFGKPTIASASQAAVSGANPGRMLQKGFQSLSASDLTPNRGTYPPAFKPFGLLPGTGETAGPENFMEQGMRDPSAQRLLKSGEPGGGGNLNVFGPDASYSSQPGGGTEWAGTSSTPMPRLTRSTALSNLSQESLSAMLADLPKESAAYPDLVSEANRRGMDIPAGTSLETSGGNAPAIGSGLTDQHLQQIREAVPIDSDVYQAVGAEMRRRAGLPERRSSADLSGRNRLQRLSGQFLTQAEREAFLHGYRVRGDEQ